MATNTTTKRTLRPVDINNAIKAADLEVGQVLEGTLVRATIHPGQDEGDFYRRYHFRRDDGTDFALNGTKVLDPNLDMVRAGSYVQIEYLGRKQLKKGQQPAHQFKIVSDYAGTGAFGGVEAGAEAEAADQAAAGTDYSAKMKKTIG